MSELAMSKSIILRRKIFKIMQEFWLDNEGLDMKEVFFINSVVFSSLLTQMGFMMFKKDDPESREKLVEYFKEIATMAEMQLDSFDLVKEMGIQ